jgi:4'-phosphopantetheinyl transferase
MLAEETDWIPARTPPPLVAGIVHVWRARLDVFQPALLQLTGWLSPEERARAARFHFEHLRQRYAAGRGLLRWLLGAYLAAPPESLAFSYSARGKPALQPAARQASIAFNLSHSDDLALFAFARAERLGVDVERIRPDIACTELAERYFSPSEAAALRRLSQEQQQAAFFETWTRKEAYIKATGEGLSTPLDQFDVSLGPQAAAVLISINGSRAEAARWSLHALQPAAGYAAALAIEGHGWRVERMEIAEIPGQRVSDL